MAALFVYGLTTQTTEVALVAGGLVLACVVLGILARLTLKNRNAYFTDASIAHDNVS